MGCERTGAADAITAEFIAGLRELAATAKAGGLAAVIAKHGISGPTPDELPAVGPMTRRAAAETRSDPAQ